MIPPLPHGRAGELVAHLLRGRVSLQRGRPDQWLEARIERAKVFAKCDRAERERFFEWLKDEAEAQASIADAALCAA